MNVRKRIVIPGEVIEPEEKDTKIILGPGLREHLGQILALNCGVLRKIKPNIYWVDSSQRNYSPRKGENVLGIVIAKAGDVYKVDINSAEPAILSYLSFEGSTKRNRPNIQIGDLLYAKILVTDKDTETEIVCIDGRGKCLGLGIIPTKGFLFYCSHGLIQKLLNPNCEALTMLGNLCAYEIVVGMNGLIWVEAEDISKTIFVVNCLSNAELLTNVQLQDLIQTLFCNH